MDSSTSGPAAQSFDSTNSEFCKVGHLYKRGGRIKTWKKRFFVLDKTTATLFYYRKETDDSPTGTILLSGYTATSATDSELGKKVAGFKLFKDANRTYFIYCDTESMRDEWLTNLWEVINGAKSKTTWAASSSSLKSSDSSLSTSSGANGSSNSLTGPSVPSSPRISVMETKRPLTSTSGYASKPVPAPPVNSGRSGSGPNDQDSSHDTDQTLIVPGRFGAVNMTSGAGMESLPNSGRQGGGPAPSSGGAVGAGYRGAGASNSSSSMGSNFDDGRTLIGGGGANGGRFGAGAGASGADAAGGAGDTTLVMDAGGSRSSNVGNATMSSNLTHSLLPPSQTIYKVRLLSDSAHVDTIERPVMRTLKFGRYVGPACDDDPDLIAFNTRVVSRLHAEIWTVNGEYYMRDTKSQSGTFLNAMRLSEPGKESKPFKIKTGDIIQFGVDYRGSTDPTAKCVSFKVELLQTTTTNPQSGGMPSNNDDDEERTWVAQPMNSDSTSNSSSHIGGRGISMAVADDITLVAKDLKHQVMDIPGLPGSKKASPAISSSYGSGMRPPPPLSMAPNRPPPGRAPIADMEETLYINNGGNNGGYDDEGAKTLVRPAPGAGAGKFASNASPMNSPTPPASLLPRSQSQTSLRGNNNGPAPPVPLPGASSSRSGSPPTSPQSPAPPMLGSNTPEKPLPAKKPNLPPKFSGR